MIFAEFCEESAAIRLEYAIKAYSNEKLTRLCGHEIVLDFDCDKGLVTIKDMFCEIDDFEMNWSEFLGHVRAQRGLAIGFS
ncbi:hypothetical protein SAMN05444003_0459 [Cognatiyoonia sediminum]|uniref:Uncharacterized protein n=2 Tax=Cognatiyoonia sediminum TaxID=1508389 RepID=A0A1M5LT78_9RHOB|nr:hypothetical protein SAMN05444003_0459 [Cognatiyoonia sediminum]